MTGLKPLWWISVHCSAVLDLVALVAFPSVGEKGWEWETQSIFKVLVSS
jgi:hypothetical protein